MASPPVPPNEVLGPAAEALPQAGAVLPTAPATAGPSQPVDALLSLPPDRLRQVLQQALDRAGLDDAAPRPSSGVPGSALLNGGLSSTAASGEKGLVLARGVNCSGRSTAGWG